MASYNRKYRLALYGLTQDDFNKMLENQKGVCAICVLPETAIDKYGNLLVLSVDHCHKTGKVRGLLCSRCNHLLGNAKDEVTILLRAVEYLNGY